MIQPLNRSTLSDPDVSELAAALLGVEVHSFVDGLHTAVRIVETEAYRGADDKAAHSYLHRRTSRTEVFFGASGHAYIYLVYGIHTMFNVVVGPVGRPDAVLVRAAEPLLGLDIIQTRRRGFGPRPKRERTGSFGESTEPVAGFGESTEPVAGFCESTALRQNLPIHRLANGPGLICQALGIRKEHYGVDLLDLTSVLQLRGKLGTVATEQIISSPRVGVSYAEECSAWNWRFRIRDSRFTSPAK